MLTAQGPQVLEFNTRFGDPECEPLMMRWDDDIVPILLQASRGDLSPDTKLNFSADPANLLTTAGGSDFTVPFGAPFRGAIGSVGNVPGAAGFSSAQYW